jgi:hypothetical protein
MMKPPSHTILLSPEAILKDVRWVEQTCTACGAVAVWPLDLTRLMPHTRKVLSSEPIVGNRVYTTSVCPYCDGEYDHVFSVARH